MCRRPVTSTDREAPTSVGASICLAASAERTDKGEVGHQAGTFVTCGTLNCMNVSLRLLHSIPDPSARLFAWLFFLTALMMMGFLLIVRHPQRVQLVHVQYNFNTVADRSK